MVLNLANYEDAAAQAVKAFWGNRAAAVERQRAAGKIDQGERAGVTSGKNMDGFLALCAEIVRANDLHDADIHQLRAVVTLPGFFRPTKLWDLVVMRKGRLVAALEFKSQVGPSFGNNFNNRTEEALGTATDIWTAYREGAFGEHPKPFIGWMMLVEDCEKSRAPVTDRSPHFPIFPDFRGASYADRYNILCKKLVQEQLYTSAALLLSSRTAVNDGKFASMAELTSLKTFITSFAGHIAAEAAR
ncbi:MAG: PaeR7I family type II restriction endonuclease [Afipia sp.]|nr:PaeR7I family type II restriction endonuclease [Afipia sp.]